MVSPELLSPSGPFSEIFFLVFHLLVLFEIFFWILLDPSIGFGGRIVGVYVEMKSS